MGVDGFITIGGAQFAKNDVVSHSESVNGNYHVTLKNGISCIFPKQEKDGARILNASFDYGDGTGVQTDVTNCHGIKIFGSDKCDNINMWGSTGAVKVSGDEHNKDEVFIDKNSSVQIIADEQQDRVVFENDFFEHHLDTDDLERLD